MIPVYLLNGRLLPVQAAVTLSVLIATLIPSVHSSMMAINLKASISSLNLIYNYIIRSFKEKIQVLFDWYRFMDRTSFNRVEACNCEMWRGAKFFYFPCRQSPTYLYSYLPCFERMASIIQSRWVRCRLLQKGQIADNHLLPLFSSCKRLLFESLFHQRSNRFGCKSKFE